MRKDTVLRSWIECFNNSDFEANDAAIQIEAGW